VVTGQGMKLRKIRGDFKAESHLVQSRDCREGLQSLSGLGDEGLVKFKRLN